MKKSYEKIEIAKNNGNFFYTGYVIEGEDWLEITTIKNEHLKFRKDQVMQRAILRNDMDDTNDTKKHEHN